MPRRYSRSDRFFGLVLVFFAIILAPYFLPILRFGLYWQLAWDHWALVSSLLIFFAVRHCHQRLTNAKQRAFWTSIGVAFAFWFFCALLEALAPSLMAEQLGSLPASVLYLLFYAALFLALELRPDIDEPIARRRLVDRLEVVGLVFLGSTVLLYFTALAPIRTEPVAHMEAQFFLVCLDFLLLLRLLYLTAFARRGLWRLTYGLLALSAVFWLFTDLSESLFPLWQFKFSDSPPLATLWFLPLFPVLLAAYFHGRAEAPPPSPDTSWILEMALPRNPASHALPLFALALPLMHLFLHSTGLLDPTLKEAREALLLPSLTVLGILAGIQLFAVGKERHYLEEIRELFNVAADACVLITPRQQRVLEANYKAEALFDLPRRRLIGTSLLARSRDPEDDRRRIEAVVSDRGVHTFDQTFLDEDGTLRSVETKACCVPFRGRPVIFSVMRDVTDRRLGERALHAAHEELRTFVQIASHDLRTPLVNLNAFTAEMRLLGEDGLKEGGLDFLEASAHNLEQLSNAFIRLSRYNLRPLHWITMDSNVLIWKVLAPLSEALHRQQSVIQLGPLPRVRADRWALEQIFQEFLTNAIHYLRPEEPGLVRVEGEETKKEVIFRVIDNGRGIAEDDWDKVFQPFRRCGRSEIPGDGMGLVFARTLIRRHGGRTWFTSTAGEGSTFYFTIAKTLVEEGSDLPPKTEAPMMRDVV